MADGRRTFLGAVAMPRLAFGTRVQVSPAIYNRTIFTVADRGSAAVQLDVFQPNCELAIQFGRRLERIRIVSEPHR